MLSTLSSTLRRLQGFAPVAALSLTIGGSTFGQDQRIDFNREVRPILADKCYQCHGPDEKGRKADLRLDIREDALIDLGGYAAIVPDHPEDSVLIERIEASDADELMPPPELKKPLTAAERDTLRRWIEQGAEYQDHWAFLPVQDPELPDVQPASWARNGIDHFILAQLDPLNIAPSPPADPHTLIRRLSLDLTGLLPSPEQVTRYLDAHRQDPDAAWLALVNRLLDSPHYGERWGRHWLDQARYADSNGYTIDGDRIMWPYRDWVIRAINDDLPFDRFTIEQLAGDLLPAPDKAQLVATGFHRNTLINQEGGTDPEQFRNEEVADRVNTTGAVWLGLTLSCAQCHTHKFDPITHREYFELFAFFNHTEDKNNVGPTVPVSQGELFLENPDPSLLSQLHEAETRLDELERNRARRQAAWEKARLTELTVPSSTEEAVSPPPTWKGLEPAEFHASATARLARLEDGSLLATRGGGRENYTVTARPHTESIRALRLRVIPHTSLPKQGPGLASNGNFVLSGFEVWQGERRIPVRRASASHEQPGYPIASAIDGDAGTGWAINIAKGSKQKMNAAHEAVFTLAETITPGDSPIRLVLRHERNGDHYAIGRFALDASPHAPAPPSADPLLAALELPAGKRTDAQRKRVEAAFREADLEFTEARSAVQQFRQKLGLGEKVSAMVMRELEKPRETFIHIRGDFLRPDREVGPVDPGVPAILPSLEPRASAERPDRLDLSHWLMHPDHPLTPRVTVNRVWMRYFGRGLVETENDFGTQGSFPSHPELLDWLSRRFVEGGWSMKSLHRLIVTSATYRQSSHARSDLQVMDPLNLQLARQSRLRVDAEIVRDASLSASGLLSRQIGGPSVQPPQPEGVYAFTQRKRSWKPDEGDNRYRRALYTRFIRSAPYPMLTTFDAPDFQSVCTRRARSNTPLQSLTLANDEAQIEMARGLAARVLRWNPPQDATSAGQIRALRVDHAFELAFSRLPTPEESAAVLRHFETQEAHYREHPEAADHFAAGSFFAADTPPALAAAWTAIARALLNTDEFITRE